MECAAMRKPGPSYENENADRPPRLQREDPVPAQQLLPTQPSAPTVASVLADQKTAHKPKVAQERNSSSPSKSARTNNAQKNLQSGQKSNGDPRPNPKADLPTPSPSKEVSQKRAGTPQKPEAGAANLNKKPSKPATALENGTCNNSASKTKTTPPSPSDNPRPVQPVLPQPLSADVRTTPTVSEKPSNSSANVTNSTASPSKPTPSESIATKANSAVA
ncbi:hypothetical protein ANCDUO_27461, partial [Ancylostoma duodenale]